MQDMTYSQQGFHKILQKTSCIECLMEAFQKGKDNSMVILWRRFFKVSSAITHPVVCVFASSVQAGS